MVGPLTEVIRSSMGMEFLLSSLDPRVASRRVDRDVPLLTDARLSCDDPCMSDGGGPACGVVGHCEKLGVSDVGKERPYSVERVHNHIWDSPSTGGYRLACPWT